jgi:hypothetical protein
MTWPPPIVAPPIVAAEQSVQRVTEPRSRRRRITIGLLIAVPTVFFGMLVAAEIAYDRAGCGSVDPTDADNYSTVSILNDTVQPVVVDHCQGSYCDVDEDAVRLAPGRRISVDAACGVTGAEMTSWRITGNDDRWLGYVAVETPRKHDGLVFPVSRASRARSTPTSAG